MDNDFDIGINPNVSRLPCFAFTVPDSKVHGDSMGATWILSAPDGPHVGPMNLAIGGVLKVVFSKAAAMKITPHSTQH